MDSHYSVKLGQLIKAFELEVLRGAPGFEDILIQKEDVNRPALQLAGFFDYFDYKRIQMIGRVEATYLAQLSAGERRTSFDQLLARDIPCLIITRGMDPFPECMELAERYNRTILRTQETLSLIHIFDDFYNEWSGKSNTPWTCDKKNYTATLNY